MKKIVLLLSLLFSISIFSQKKIVEGLERSKSYTYEQISNKAQKYFYKSKGIIKEVGVMHYQIDILFFDMQDDKILNNIFVNYEAGLHKEDEEVSYLKETVNFQLGQYDFDDDGLDELVIATQDYNEHDISESDGITINILKLKNNKFVNIGTLTALWVNGEAKAKIKKNSIIVDKHLRGFYHKWTYKKGKFIDESDL